MGGGNMRDGILNRAQRPAPTQVVAKLRTIGETAELFNTSTRTVRRLIELGDLQVHRIRGLVRISDADICGIPSRELSYVARAT